MDTGQIVGIVMRAGLALGETIFTAIQSGDIKTLEALARICPRPEVIAAKDKALQEEQRRKAREELGPG